MQMVRSLALCLLIGLSLYLFPNVPKTILDINNSNYRALTSREQVPAFKEFFLPRGGETVLPVPARMMIGLLRKHQATSFRYSSLIGSNEEVRQRLLEGAYPIRFSEVANHVVALSHEPLPVDCRMLDTEGGISLVYCP